MEENIFSDIKKADIRLPLDILCSYVDQFNSTFGKALVFETKGSFEKEMENWAKVDLFEEIKEPAEPKSVTRAFVVAPSLNSYRMLVLKVSYLRSKVYPCEIYNALVDKKDICNTADELEGVMTRLFKSEDFKKPIRILLSQIG